ncbi:hypothetical protein AC00_1566 [Escherichia coli 1-250-04_S3_C1]|uniref:RHS Repeat family protein n=1 Tax=Escherichia coli 1-250-04_S3_C1 TaxID=1444135 RepID=A0AAN4SYD1_ECOLX|nr:hypothetical protein AC00_1566 [Escherichia coli 1-250-04_S3_C1]KEO34860.1 hypothetical protein AC28_1561 [Escherichia coli 1-250-04_S3_C2]
MYDSTGHLLREFAYDENHCMTLHRQPGGEGYYYQWGWYDGPDDAAWRAPLRNLHRDTPPGIKSGLFQPVALKVQAGVS